MIELGRIRALVFDLDGTLIDSYEAITESLNHACAHFGQPPLPPDRVRLMVGRGLEQLVAHVLGAERMPTGVRLFRERYASVYAKGTRPMPEAPATLRILQRRGYCMAVASNKPARFSEPILAVFDMLARFDCVEGPDTAGVTKPDPAMVKRCLDAMGVTADEALYVGDMVLDIETAARAGLPVVLVRGGSSTDDELDLTGELVIPSLPRLAELLQGCWPDS